MQAEFGGCKCPSPVGTRKGRNLVVCIDGTSNQFGRYNTNVVELYSKIIKDDDQITYYNSGIGTYARPSWKSFKHWLQVVDNVVDLAIAWNFERIIMGAYRWLSDNFMENDRIFLFGFSRGAYQVRALAGMIETVGLIHRGNEEQIPFAFELYSHSQESKSTSPDESLAARFKAAFSRPNVRVHFVGVWDTVSSVGIVRGKTLPRAHSADHICFFRHALALDERRVKFLPEYVHGGASIAPSASPAEGEGTTVHGVEDSKDRVNGSASSARSTSTGTTTNRPHIKEVWFPGTHSDIGGGNQLNTNLDLGRTPMLWMSFEAVSCGLRLRPSKVEWAWGNLGEVRESMHGVWYLLEWLPMKRLTYKDKESTTTRLHRGRGRRIRPGQLVHSSVAFCKPVYDPRAKLPPDLASPSSSASSASASSTPPSFFFLKSKRTSSRDYSRSWKSIVGKSGAVTSPEWRDLLEMDIFDSSPAAIKHLVKSLSLQVNGGGPNIGMVTRREDMVIWIYRLSVITASDEGLMAICKVPEAISELIDVYYALSRPTVGLGLLQPQTLAPSSKSDADDILKCIVDILNGFCKDNQGFFNKDEIAWLRNTCLKGDSQGPDGRALGIAKWWISVAAAEFGVKQGTASGDKLGRTSTLFNEPLKMFLLSSQAQEHLSHEFGSLVVLGTRYGFLPPSFLSEQDILRLFSLAQKSGTQVQKSSQKMLLAVPKWNQQHPESMSAFLEKVTHPDPSIRCMVLGVFGVMMKADDYSFDKNAVRNAIQERLGDSVEEVRHEALNTIQTSIRHDLWATPSIISRLVDLGARLEGPIVAAAREVLGSMPVTHFEADLFQSKLEGHDSDVLKHTIEFLTSILGARNAVFIPDDIFNLLWKLLWAGDRLIQNHVIKFLVSGLTSPARDIIFTDRNISECVSMLSSDDPSRARVACQLLFEAVTKDQWGIFPIRTTVTGLERCLIRQEWIIKEAAISACTSYIQSGQPLSEAVRVALEACLIDDAPIVRDAVLNCYKKAVPHEAGSNIFKSSTLPEKLCIVDALHIELFTAIVSLDDPYNDLFTNSVRDIISNSLSILWLDSLPVKFYVICAGHRELFLRMVTPVVLEKLWERLVNANGFDDVLDIYRRISQDEVLASAYFGNAYIGRLLSVKEQGSTQIAADNVLALILSSDWGSTHELQKDIRSYFLNTWSTRPETRIKAIKEYMREYMRACLGECRLCAHMLSPEIIQWIRRCYVECASDGAFSQVREQWLKFYSKVLDNESLGEQVFTPELAHLLSMALRDTYPNVRGTAFEFYRRVVAHSDHLHTLLLSDEVLSSIYSCLAGTNTAKHHLAIEFYTEVLNQDPEIQARILTQEVLNGVLRYVYLGDPEILRTSSHEQASAMKFCIMSLKLTNHELQDKILTSELLARLPTNLHAGNSGKVKSLIVDFYCKAIDMPRFSQIYSPAATRGFLNALSPEHINGRAVLLQMSDIDSWHSNRAILKFLSLAISRDNTRANMFTPDSISLLWPTIRRLGLDFELTEDLVKVLTSTEHIRSLVYDSLVIQALCDEKDTTVRAGVRLFLAKTLKDDEIHRRMCTTYLRKHFPEVCQCGAESWRKYGYRQVNRFLRVFGSLR